MAWTEQDYQEIVARLMAESIGVNEVPDAESTDDISSLPAYQPANGTEVPTVVKASLELLVAPALEAADKANEAADKAENNATAAQTAANTANEKAELAAQAASDANAAKEEAEAATQSANNAASNAEEKAAAANTAAQDAEKVANNPTYIGTDHYVYVYNKETDSFDKTGIYCKGEPGSSFRVTGEYATLEALKSAVPDGSAVDGFMAVGTEAPYDYYAWVNGEWVNQGKIAGGGSGNVVVIPAAAMSLSDQATSDEIFNAFGGKQNLIDIIKKVKDEDCVVIAKTDDNPNAVLQQTFSVVNATYVNDNNLILGLASWSVDVTSQMIIQVIDGIASYNEISTPLMTEAPSDGNVYGRKNKDWVKVPEKSDVLTKNNVTEYTPTEPYHPATKKYVDDNATETIILETGDLLLTNFVYTDELTSDAKDKILAVFGSFENYSHIVEKMRDTNCRLKFNFASNETLRAEVGSVCSQYLNKYEVYNEPRYCCLSFILNYCNWSTLENNTKLVSFIYKYNENCMAKCINLVTSDNLTTITKKTAAEYEALGSKDANTAYCVTD